MNRKNEDGPYQEGPVERMGQCGTVGRYSRGEPMPTDRLMGTHESEINSAISRLENTLSHAVDIIDAMHGKGGGEKGRLERDEKPCPPLSFIGCLNAAPERISNLAEGIDSKLAEIRDVLRLGV